MYVFVTIYNLDDYNVILTVNKSLEEIDCHAALHRFVHDINNCRNPSAIEGNFIIQ